MGHNFKNRRKSEQMITQIKLNSKHNNKSIPRERGGLFKALQHEQLSRDGLERWSLL